MSEAKKPDELAKSPGPQFVKIRWLKPVADEPVGMIQWCDGRRANGLVRDGFAEILPE